MRYKTFVIFVFISFFISCYDLNFYEVKSLGGLYVMPLIKPYRLKELDLDHALESCKLDFRYNIDTSGFNHENVTDINIVEGIIFGHGERTIYHPNDWFVIIPAKKIEKKFKERVEWEHYLQSEGIDSIILYSAGDLFLQYQKTSELPWHELEKFEK